jgi:hypothetical protein
MDTNRFNEVASVLAAVPSRRDIVRGLFATGLGFGARRLPEAAAAKKKRKKKPQKPSLNAFGCVNIGGTCRGNDDNCCSGLCQGKKPKKGRKDTSTCVAHNTGGCTAERSACFTGNESSLCGPAAICLATTGNAGFCAASVFSQEVNCRPCGKDQDCEAAGFGQGSACVLVNQGFCAASDTNCSGINGSSGTACLPPGA